MEWISSAQLSVFHLFFYCTYPDHHIAMAARPTRARKQAKKGVQLTLMVVGQSPYSLPRPHRTLSHTLHRRIRHRPHHFCKHPRRVLPPRTQHSYPPLKPRGPPFRPRHLPRKAGSCSGQRRATYTHQAYKYRTRGGGCQDLADSGGHPWLWRWYRQ